MWSTVLYCTVLCNTAMPIVSCLYETTIAGTQNEYLILASLLEL